MRRSPAEHSSSNYQRVDSSSPQDENRHVGYSDTSRVYRRRDDREIAEEPRWPEGFRRTPKRCFGACGKARELRTIENLKLGNCSTQTSKPWSRGSCVSKLQLRKSNQTSITSIERRLLGLDTEPNDDYNRLFEFKCESDRKTKGSVTCEAKKNPIFKETAVQIDVVEYKIVVCSPAKKQEENLDSNLPTLFPKSRVSPGPSTGQMTKGMKGTYSPLKKKAGISLGGKKPTVKKRSIIAVGKKAEKKITASNTYSGGAKFPAVKKSRTTAKKSRAVDAKEKTVTSNHNVVPGKALKGKINEQEKARVDLVKKSEEIGEGNEKEKFENDGNRLPYTRVKENPKIGRPRESQKRKISLPQKAFEMEKNFSRPVSRCSSKCQGVPQQGSEYAAEPPTSASSTSKKHSENELTVFDETDKVTRKSIGKQRPTKSSFPRERSQENVPESSDEIRENKSGSVSIEDQSRSFHSGKVPPRRNPRSSVMTIWYWLRERYRNTMQKESSSFVGLTDNRVKDPFLSLLFPTIPETRKRENSQNYQV